MQFCVNELGHISRPAYLKRKKSEYPMMSRENWTTSANSVEFGFIVCGC